MAEYNFLDGSRMKRLRELQNIAKPYRPDESEPIDNERSQANQEYFFLAYQLVPVMIQYIERVQGVIHNETPS